MSVTARASIILWAIVALVGANEYSRAQYGVTTGNVVSSVNGQNGDVTVLPGNFIGTFTVATLPACNNSTTKYGSVAYVTDLGGGANNAKCIGGFWQHFTLGAPQSVSAAAGTVTISALSSAPIQNITGSLLSGTMTVVLSGLIYPGYTGTICPPSSLLGTLVFSLLGVTTTLLGTACHNYVINSDGATVKWLS